MDSIADIPPAVTLADRIDLPVSVRRRGFWIGLTFALLVHILLIVGIRHASPRYVGDPSGSPDAIAVDLVTEADLKSRETVSLPSGPPQSKATPAPPPQPEMKAAPEPEEQTEKAPPDKPAETPAPEAKTETAAAEPQKETPAVEAEKKSADPSFDLPDLTSLEDLAKAKQDKDPTKSKEEKAAEAKPKVEATPQPKKPPLKPAVKDQQQQMAMAMPPPGGGVSRPPGITRSGENDEFGRGVIRALRATMPPPMGKYGRVTVRLFLDERGDLTEVKLLESSGSNQLDQSVVFATQQTNYPLPPRNATVADRTFIISYVYRLGGPQ